MASLAKHPESKYWHGFYRDARGKQHSFSTKIEHSPQGEDARDVAQRAAKSRRLAQDIANQMEEEERGNPTEVHLRSVLNAISLRVNKRRLHFKKVNDYLNEWLTSTRKRRAWRT